MKPEQSPKSPGPVAGRRRFLAACASGLAGLAAAPALGWAQAIPGLPGMPGLDPAKALTDKLTRTLLEAQKKQAEKKKKAAGKGPPPPAKGRARQALSLAPLPYAPNALVPHLSAPAMTYHHGKVAQSLLARLQRLVQGTPYGKWSLDQIIKQAYDRGDSQVFNLSAELYNHNFFFPCLKPGGGGRPPDKLARFLEKSYGTLERFKQDFAATSETVFGSGWVWLYEYQGRPRLQAAPGALNPVAFGLKPLLCLDLWEHAYYLDFQDARAKYVAVFLEHLVNWDFAAKNLG